MPRIRSLKPEFAKDETLAGLSRDVRLHYAVLWTYADDEGRGLDNPKLIKAELWPLDDDATAAVVEGWQDELARADRIVRYEVDGKRYFQVVRWHEHQHPQKKSPSKVPPPPDLSESRNGTRPLAESDASGPVEVAPVVVEGEVVVEVVTPLSASPKAKRAAQLPDDFTIDNGLRSFAADKCSRVDVDAETEQWRDFHRAKGDTAKDWRASWRTWMRNAEKWTKTAKTNGHPAPVGSGPVSARRMTAEELNPT